MFLLMICTMVGTWANERLRLANELALENDLMPRYKGDWDGPQHNSP